MRRRTCAPVTSGMLTPMVLALTRTSPSPGCGVGTSTYSSADGSPGRRSRMAFIGSDLDQLSAMIGLRKTPMPPSISTSTTSPGFIHKGGLRAKPTPSGVPVDITSPAMSGVQSEQ
jgi:hypothetical protein